MWWYLQLEMHLFKWGGLMAGYTDGWMCDKANVMVCWRWNRVADSHMFAIQFLHLFYLEVFIWKCWGRKWASRRIVEERTVAKRYHYDILLSWYHSSITSSSVGCLYIVKHWAWAFIFPTYFKQFNLGGWEINALVSPSLLPLFRLLFSPIYLSQSHFFTFGVFCIVIRIGSVKKHSS